MLSIAELRKRENEWIEEFELIEDPAERFQALATRSPKSKFPELYRTDQHLVRACVSRVWLGVGVVDQVASVWLDSEAPALNGIGSFFADLYSDAKIEAIASHPPTFIDRLDLDRFLTPTRRRGVRLLYQTLLERIEDATNPADD